METLTTVWAIMGFIAFLSVFPLQDRVGKLERQLRNSDNSEPFESRTELSDKMREYIGKRVILDFYDGEEDMDILTYAPKTRGGATVIDCDEKWVMVSFYNGKKTQQKLLRINSIKSIASVTPEQNQQAKT